MAVHKVQQGECLSSIAARFGLRSWERLLEVAGNEELPKKRLNPNVLAPGDEVAVPDQVSQKRLSIATDHLHKFVVNLPKVKLRIALVNRLGEPYEGKPFTVNVGKREIKGTTVAGGIVEIDVPATEATARLRAWLFDSEAAEAPPTIDRELAIGHIDPVELASGTRGRLSNLGYRCSLSEEPIEDLDDPVLVAVRSFRAKNGLPEVDRPGAQGNQADNPDENGSDATNDSGAAGENENDAPTADEIADYVERLMDGAFREKLLAVYAGESGA